MEWTLYVDLDAYYVACELRDRPELEGREVLVGPDPTRGPTRGVVLSASYPARAKGARSAMPVQRAAELVPDAVWIPPDFPKYERLAGEVRALLGRSFAQVVPLSIDEAAIVAEFPGPEEARVAAGRIQAELRTELRLSASVGVATHRTVAKIASDRAKPGGIVVVTPEGTAVFLAPLPVRSIPGIGPKAEAALAAHGVVTIADLADRKKVELRRLLGRFGDELVDLARGHPRPLARDDLRPRSRSTDRTFARDVETLDELQSALEGLARSLGGSLRAEHLAGLTVGVAIRWADFSRTQRSRTGSHALQNPAELAAEGRRLLESLWTEERHGRARAARTLSLRVEGLRKAAGRQLTLPSSEAVGEAALN